MSKIIFTLFLILTGTLWCFAQTDTASQQSPNLPIIGEVYDTTYNPEEEIFMIVEQMPEFPGGEEARYKFLGENIQYPQEARINGIQGTVYVTFTVEKSGSISNVRILRGIGGGCDEEVVRLVKAMPDWKPGMQGGKPVRVQFNMPVKYQIGTIKEEK